MVNLVMFLATFAFGFVASLVHGWALAKMWGWFVVPVFTSLPAITTLQAVGVQMVVSVFFTATVMSLANIKTAVKGKDNRPFSEQMVDGLTYSIGSMMVSLLSVGVGWIWHTYIM